MAAQFEKTARADFTSETNLWCTYETVASRVRAAMNELPGTSVDGEVLMTPLSHEKTARGATVAEARSVLEANDLSPNYVFSHTSRNDDAGGQYIAVSFFLWLDLLRIWVAVHSESKVYADGLAAVATRYLDTVVAEPGVSSFVPGSSPEQDLESPLPISSAASIRRTSAKYLHIGLKWIGGIAAGVVAALIAAYFIFQFGWTG
jgi:hypothetical protein